MFTSEWHFLILFLAIILDFIIGDPDWLWRRVSHPVVIFGWLIDLADKKFNQLELSVTQKRINGLLVIAGMSVLALIIGLIFQFVLVQCGIVGFIIEVVILAIFIAQKSMIDHVIRIVEPLKLGDIQTARHALSMIVGRKTDDLDEASISRAAIESISENFSDGVVAPVFWYTILGLPGLFIYKMVNTADSMIGYMDLKYRDFGRASAKLDDAMNWAPARLSALLIASHRLILSGWAATNGALQIVWRDAKKHRSPNAGWPETAMAAVLSVRLAGPREYHDFTTKDEFLNANGRSDLTFRDIEDAQTVFKTACLVQLFTVLLLCVVKYSI